MKRQYLIVFLAFSLFTEVIWAQIEFEKGYFIDIRGNKIECLIKNYDWKNNPNQIEYKKSQNSEVLKKSIGEINEFSVDGNSKYRRFLVDLDRSENYVETLSEKREPQFKKEELLLKVFIEGKATLYYYEDGNLVRFFYSLDLSQPEPLVYKKYRRNNNVLENNQYKQQLLNTLGVSETVLRKLKYNKKSLSGIFDAYNIENDKDYDYNSKQFGGLRKGKLHLSILAGATFRSLSFEREGTGFATIDFGTNPNYLLGAELEFVFPFNKNKWALVLEPVYTNYKAENTPVFDNTEGANAEFNAIELSMGVRYYMFLSKSSKLYINGIYMANFVPDTEIQLGSGVTNAVIGNNGGLAFGLGYDLNSKFSLEARYVTFRDITKGAQFRSADFAGVSLILGVNLF